MNESQAERVYRILYKGVMSGELRPGTLVTETELADQFHTSRTPVREALLRLDAEGLFERKAGKYAVVEMSYSKGASIYVARAALEGMAARIVTTVATDDELEALGAIVEESQTALQSGDLERVADLNFSFHNALLESAGDPYFVESVRARKFLIRRYRRAAVVYFGRASEGVEAHERILAVMQRRDPEQVQREVERHVFEAGAALLNAVETFFGIDAETHASVMLRQYFRPPAGISYTPDAGIERGEASGR